MPSEAVEATPGFDQLERWRFDYFLKLTGDDRLSDGLTRTGLSPHELEDLLAAGCGLDDALRIIAPL